MRKRGWSPQRGIALTLGVALVLCLQASLAQVHVAVRADGQLSAYAHWTMPLSEPPRALLTGDTDGDGQREVVVLGRQGFLSLLEADGTVVWANPQPEELSAGVLADLDGDGRLEVLTGGPRGVIALDGAGRPLWFYRTAYPVQTLTAKDVSGDGRAEVFAATEYENVYQLTPEGKLIWHYWSQRRGFGGTVTGLAVGDFDDDQKAEVALAFDFPGYKDLPASGHVLLLDDNGQELWRRNETSGVLAIVAVDPDGWGKPLIAAGTRAGRLIVRFGDGAERWGYELGTPVHQVLGGDMDDDGLDEVIAVGRDHLLALDDDGSPVWERTYSHQTLCAALGDWEGNIGRPMALLTLQPGLPRATVELVNVRGGTEESYALSGVASLVHLSDLNLDGWAELLVASDEAVQLLSRARGAAQTRVGWQYRVRGAITALNAADVDGDGRSEVLLGSEDHNLYVLKDDGSLSWRHGVAGAVCSVASGDVDGDGRSEVVVGYNEMVERGEPQRSGLVVLRGDGRVLWAYETDQWIWVVSSADLDGDGRAELIAGAGNDRVLAVSDGHSLAEGDGYSLAEGDGRVDLVTATTGGALYVLTGGGSLVWRYAIQTKLLSLYPGDVDGDQRSELVTGSDDGVLYVVGPGGSLQARHEVGQTLTALYVGDIDGDRRAEILAGTRDGRLDMYEHTPNRPPLVVNPNVVRAEAGYVYSVTVSDPEDDRVEVTLQIQDPFSGEWHSAETNHALASGTLYWFVNPFHVLALGRTASYSFTYSDGLNSGTLGRAVGPRVPGLPWYVYAALLAAVGLLLFSYRRWSVSPARLARLLYARLASSPQDLPAAMRELAASPTNSNETLIRLSQRARAVGDKAVANLAEGYLLLSSRPAAGLQVVAAALGQIAAARGGGKPALRSLVHLVPLYELLADLLEANTVGRILVLRPQLQRVLRQWELPAAGGKG